VWDAVRRSGQWLHGERGRGDTRRQRKVGDGGACSVQHEEEEESRLGQKVDQASGAVGPTRPEAERNSFSK
jgi:hypothetical protein